jgi:hypothetical protein
MSAVVRSEVKNALIMESVLEVSGPFHSSQGGLGLSVLIQSFYFLFASATKFLAQHNIATLSHESRPLASSTAKIQHTLTKTSV